MKFRNKLTFHSLVYTFSNFLNKGIGFLLLPILTRILTPEDYGHIAMFTLWTAILVPLISLNSSSAVVRFYYDTEKKILASYIGGALILSVSMSLLFVTITLIFSSPLSSFLSLPTIWLVAGVLNSLFLTISTIYLGILRVEERSLTYAVLQNTSSLLNAGLSLYLVVILYTGWKGRTGGIFIANVVMGLTIIYFMLKEKLVDLQIKTSQIKELLFFGGPLILHNLTGILAASTDKIFLNNMIGVKSVGLYNVSYAYASIIGMIANSIHLAFVPYAYERIKKGDYRKVWETGVKIIGIVAFLFIVLLFFSPFYYKYYLGKSFSSASKFFVFLGVGEAITSVYYLGATFNFWYKKTVYISGITLSKFIANLFLNYTLIKIMGDSGAAVATMISSILAAALSLTTGFIFYRKYRKNSG